MRFPKVRVAALGVPITRIRVFLGLYWGPCILGTTILGISGLEGPKTNGPYKGPVL